MSYLPSSPGPTNLPDVFEKYPERSALMLRLVDDILRGDSALSVAERELIFAFGSAQNACDFCHASHRPVAAAFGIEESVLDDILADIDTAGVDDKLKPVLHFVKKLTLTPSRVTRADADAVFDAGWDERAFVDIVSICSVQNYFNRFVDGIGVDVSDEVARRTGAEILPTIGYRGLAERLEN
ncbi:MAG: carboxymuconolactone decarboxylase family protein [Gammaproteobacteria bacterium]